MAVCVWLILVALDCDVYIFVSAEGAATGKNTEPSVSSNGCSIQYVLFRSALQSRGHSPHYVSFARQSFEIEGLVLQCDDL